jgi:hypothetical protein
VLAAAGVVLAFNGAYLFFQLPFLHAGH